MAFFAGRVALGEPLAGTACAIDGDTLVIGSTRVGDRCSPGVHVRLFAIDAPERDQTCTSRSGKAYRCGEVAANLLREMIADRSVECERRGDKDRYGRVIAICTVEGANLNEAMVRRGWALSSRRYGVDFVAAEDAARSAKRGLWSGTFIDPSQWRGAKR